MTWARPSEAERRQRREQEKSRNLAALASSLPRRAATYAGTTAGPAPKTEPKRCPALLEMAEGRPCLLLVPGICNHRIDTTVACHSNLAIHGKAGARKADDQYSVWGCHACHAWLDQSNADAPIKEQVFMSALARQVRAWRQILEAPGEPQRFKRAATWALARIAKETP